MDFVKNERTASTKKIWEQIYDAAKSSPPWMKEMEARKQKRPEDSPVQTTTSAS